MPHLFFVNARRLVVVAMRLAIGVALVLPLLGRATGASEIRLFSAAAMQSVFKDIAAEFERSSGHTLNITYATIGAITQRVQDGETADFVIGSRK